MASIGVLPTKTSVELREPDGDKGTIPAATSASAGVMTAAQVKMLETVFQWHQTVAGGGGVIEIITPAPAAPSIGNAQLDAFRKGMGNVSERVAQLERAVASHRPTEAIAHVPDQSERIHMIEQVTTSNSQQIATLASALDEIARLVEEAHQRLTFIEGHAVASVQVETKDQAA